MMGFDHGGTVFAVARSLGLAPEELLDFSASINPLGMSPGVREAVCAALDRSLHYPDSEATELCAALARLHGVADDSVCVANGSTELIYLLPRLVQGRRALVIAPPFSEYAKALTIAGYEIEYLDLSPADGFALPMEQLAARLSGGIDLLFLCNPGNPTGRLYLRPEVKRVISLCADCEVFLVLDEAFMDFCEDESSKLALVAAGNAVLLRSMTKFYAMPGLRLGYALASKEIAGRLRRLRAPWSVNTPAQVAGLVSLSDEDYRRRTIDCIATERDFLFRSLSSLPGVHPYPSAANYLLAELEAGMTAATLSERLLRERILIRDCSSFRGLTDRFFRVAVRSRRENLILSDALGRALLG